MSNKVKRHPNPLITRILAETPRIPINFEPSLDDPRTNPDDLRTRLDELDECNFPTLGQMFGPFSRAEKCDFDQISHIFNILFKKRFKRYVI